MINNKLPLPVNQKAYILHSLLNRESLSEQDYKINGFRSRISNLRLDDGVNIQYTQKDFINEFGRKRKYHDHYIPEPDQEDAVKIYYKINKSTFEEVA